jgi:hypothetical protein
VVGRHWRRLWLELGRQLRIQERREKTEKLGARKQKWGTVHLPTRFHPLYPNRSMFGKNVVHDAWCSHRPCTTYTDNDRGAGPTYQSGGVNRSMNHGNKAKNLTGVTLSSCGHVILGIVAVIFLTPTMTVAPRSAAAACVP